VDSKTAASRKTTFTVLWNLHVFHVVTILHLRALFNPPWLIHGNSDLLLDKFFVTGWSERQRQLVIYIGNTPVNKSRMTQDLFGHIPLKRFSYPPYFLNISPSDFALFEKINNVLSGWEIPDEIDCLEVITEMLNRVSGRNYLS
jgi:hypothetical protein